MTSAASEQAPHKRRIPGWLELILLLVTAILLSVGLKAFLVQMFFVPSESMEPLFVKNDRILVQKVSYWSGDVQRGDVVVFKDPGDWLGAPPELNTVQTGMSLIGLYPTGGHLVKRVIAVGGDRVECCDRQGRILVNGVPLNEASYVKDPKGPASTRDFDVQVPEGRLWVMGDNRSNSEDSRYHQRQNLGTIPADYVVGKVWAIVWPLGRAHFVTRPETFDNPDLDDR